ncbi:hypothetical protein [Methylotenera versatilis]|uniref:hypothetical protein n=1 Tax=Methylotenera versatilis TaxID=1055487 RepID=UPI00068B2683|nr:hypothetical protein [Methylotenera versatilis]
MNNLDKLDYWRLSDELSLDQAACLIIGINPSSEEGANCFDWQIHEQPFGYHAALTAITHALKRGDIHGKISQVKLYDTNGYSYDVVEDSIIVKDSTVEVESLKTWLTLRGFKTGFFFPTPVDSADYLDRKNPRYAPKLAMTVRAWQAVTNAGNRSPKQALEKWIREHAAEFGLVDDDGNPVQNAVEECGKVANWSPGGGVPKSSA